MSVLSVCRFKTVNTDTSDIVYPSLCFFEKKFSRAESCAEDWSGLG